MNKPNKQVLKLWIHYYLDKYKTARNDDEWLIQKVKQEFPRASSEGIVRIRRYFQNTLKMYVPNWDVAQKRNWAIRDWRRAFAR